MVMGSAAKFISRRLFSNTTWNIREEAKIIENMYRKKPSPEDMKLLLEKIELCSTEMKSLMDNRKRVSDIRNSIIKFDKSIIYSAMLGCACATSWYYLVQIYKINKGEYC